MKFCTGCKYLLRPFPIRPLEYAECILTAHRDEMYHVDGRISYTTAKNYRKEGEKCGPDGKLWVGKK